MSAHPTTEGATGLGLTIIGVLAFALLLSCAGPALDAAEQAQSALNDAGQDLIYAEARDKRAAREREACLNAPVVWIDGQPVCIPRKGKRAANAPAEGGPQP